MNLKPVKSKNGENVRKKENIRYKVAEIKPEVKYSSKNSKMSRNIGLKLNDSKISSLVHLDFNEIMREYVESRETTVRRISAMLEERSRVKSFHENSGSSNIQPIKKAFLEYSL